jgi:streptogramin lyase
MRGTSGRTSRSSRRASHLLGAAVLTAGLIGLLASPGVADPVGQGTPVSGPGAGAWTVGSDGALWFTVRAGSPSAPAEIARLDLHSDAVSTYPAGLYYQEPSGPPGPGLNPPDVLAAAPGGTIWFASDIVAALGRLAIGTGSVTINDALVSGPDGGPTPAAGNSMIFGPGSKIWLNTGDPSVPVETLDPNTGQVRIPKLGHAGPNAAGGFMLTVTNFAVGSDGNLWFTDNFGGVIGRITARTDKLSLYSLPSGASPDTITAGRDGNLWFLDDSEHVIRSINPRTGKVRTFGRFSLSPRDLTAACDGNIWVGESTGEANMPPFKLARFNPQTHAVTEYPVVGSTANDVPAPIIGAPDGNVWFNAAGGVAKVGTGAGPCSLPTG